LDDLILHYMCDLDYDHSEEFHRYFGIVNMTNVASHAANLIPLSLGRISPRSNATMTISLHRSWPRMASRKGQASARVEAFWKAATVAAFLGASVCLLQRESL
jgi:hypothetical protein